MHKTTPEPDPWNVPPDTTASPPPSLVPETGIVADARRHFDWVADHDERARRSQRYFRGMIATLLAHHIPPGSRVLEWGCAQGNLLAALKPSRGLGLDISQRMLSRARNEHGGDAANSPDEGTPGTLEFREGDAQESVVDEPFDAIVLDYLGGYLGDLQRCFENLHASAHSRTRLYITSLNTVWRPLLTIFRLFGLVLNQPQSNWLSTKDLVNLLELSGWEVVRSGTEALCPVRIPLLDTLLNRYLVRLPLFRHLGSTLFLIARPTRKPSPAEHVGTAQLSCSVVVPVRNESGNIRSLLDRLPTLGSKTEVIFVEGNSTDDTWDVVQRVVREYSGPHAVSCMQQPGRGKWDAVKVGFERAREDVLMILDGDLSVMPEDLPKFMASITDDTAEFVNGCRLVYPMENRAMRFLNMLGNKAFAVLLSATIGQPVKDSLCGTKVLLRSDYRRLLARIEPYADLDPYGDFSLLFGAAALDLKIRDIPVRYKARTYGDTNISRFSGGFLLWRTVLRGLQQLRFPAIR